MIMIAEIKLFFGKDENKKRKIWDVSLLNRP